METFTLRQLKTLGSKEMLFAELLGKISERIKMPKGTMPFYRKKQQVVDAGYLIENFIETGDVILRQDTVEDDGKFKKLTKVRIVGGKDKKKPLTRGFEEMPNKVYQKSLVNYRLRTPDLEVLKTMSGVLFYRSEFCTQAYLERIHEVTPVDIKSRELPVDRTIRYGKYKKEALGLHKFYLPAKFDGSGRMYYEGASLEGFRPHGKCYESHAFEMEKRVLSAQGREALEALSYDDVPLDSATSKEEILSCLRIPQIAKALETGITGMTLECDVTNSGLLIAGLGFASPEMLKATNGYGGTVREDSHKVFGDAFGLSRADAKKFHVTLLHGASNEAIAKKLGAFLEREVPVSEVIECCEKAYGKAYHNINNIAQYGRAIMSNFRSTVSWDMPDGFRATHTASTLHVPMELQLQHRKVRVTHEMPILLDGRGAPVYDKYAPGCKPNTSTKMMGLYANIIHSIDAYVMREVIRSGISLLCKHDAFLIHPNDVELLKTTLQGIYSELFQMDLITNILAQIEETTGVKAPELFRGDAKDMMSQSHLFVTVE